MMKKLNLIFLIIGWLLIGCDTLEVGLEEPTAVINESDIAPTSESTVTIPDATATTVPELTLRPELTATSKPTAQPELTATESTSVNAGFAILPTEIKALVVVADETTLYAGPGEEYGEVGGMFGGLPIPVNGISEDGLWYHAHCPDAPDPTTCDYWVSADPSITQPLDELPQHGALPSEELR